MNVKKQKLLHSKQALSTLIQNLLYNIVYMQYPTPLERMTE